MAAPLILMLKTTILPKRLIPEQLRVSDGEMDRFGVDGNGVKYAKKSRKLFKSGKSKSEKMSKSQNLAKLGKSRQKVEIQLISMLQKIDRNS